MKVFAFKEATDQEARYMEIKYYVSGKSEKDAQKRFKKEFGRNFGDGTGFYSVEQLSKKEGKSINKKTEHQLSYYTNLIEMYTQSINSLKTMNQREPLFSDEVKISNQKKFKKKDKKKLDSVKSEARLLNIKGKCND